MSALQTLDVTVSIPVGQSPIDSRRIQQIVAEVEQLIQAKYDDATYVEHEIREVVAA
jgi:hypothetical protein